jgi:hypothetical protein
VKGKINMSTFKDFLNETKDCNKVSSIQEINDQYNYKDKIGLGGSLEWDLISCGQDGSSSGYNELQRFYDEHMPDNYKGLSFHHAAMKALCKCCKELPHEKRTHEAFKKCVGKKLGIEIK